MKEYALTNEFIDKCRLHIKFDTIRISKPDEKMFLIIGFKKHTKDNWEEYWSNSIGGDRIDFEYTEEHCIASGNNEDELIESIKQYEKLSKMSWDEFFNLDHIEQTKLFDFIK